MSRVPFPTITQIKVKNFRSLADVTIDLDPLTVFVGKNGAGKSNIIDVLRFVRDALILGLDAGILKRHGMSALRKWSAKGRPFDIVINLFMKQEGFWEGEYGFSLGSETRGAYRVKEEHCIVKSGRGKVAFEIKEGKLIQTDVAGAVVQIDIPNPITSLHLSTIAGGNFFLVRDVIKNMGFYTIYPDLLREPQKPANATPLDEKGQNLSSVLREMKRAKQLPASTISEALGQVVHGIHDFSVTQVGGYLVTRLHHEKGGPAFELVQESDGTLRMLGILTALYQTPSRTLLAIEEPELTIHPGALGVLCDAMKEASSYSQIVITTHSPDLIYHFAAENLRVVENPEGETLVGPVESGQRKAIAQKLFAPGELMRMEGLRREIPPPKPTKVK